MLRRMLPLLVLLAGLALFFILGLEHALGFDALRAHRQVLAAWVGQHACIAPLIYMSIYALVVMLSVPGATVMTISGGFLFGTWAGAAYAVIAATLGATILFQVAKGSLGDFLLARAGPGIRRMRDGFADNAFHYLLALRLVPLFPFFLVNLAPAFLGVRWTTYVAATFIGIMPAAFIYALVGSGIGTLFERGGDFSPAAVLTPQLIAGLCGLAVLALLPVAYRRWRGDAGHRT
jgi:uncharacterized membrane protein YdjX (TVP38/TMEM64 family)